MRKTTKTKARVDKKNVTKMPAATKRATDYCRVLIGVLHDDWSDCDLDEANTLIHEALSATDHHAWTEHDCYMQPYDSDAEPLPCVSVILKPHDLDAAIALVVKAISPLVAERCDLSDLEGQDREVIEVQVQRGLEWWFHAPNVPTKSSRGRIVNCGGDLRQRLDHDEHGDPVLVCWRAGQGKGFAY